MPAPQKKLASLFPDGIPELIIIGHRGAAGYYPENTMASFKAAYRMQADMIELDVGLSKDGVPVVIHDDSLDRTTNGKGPVSALTCSELKTLDAGSWKDKTFARERIPTLREVLRWAKERIPVNVEIKASLTTETNASPIVKEVLQVISELEMQRQVLISSFDGRAIQQVKALEPGLLTGLLYESKQQGRKDPDELVKEWNADTFHCSRHQWKARWASDSMPPVFVYTVNRKTSMERLIKKGVKGIFTDYPDTLVNVKKHQSIK